MSVLFLILSPVMLSIHLFDIPDELQSLFFPHGHLYIDVVMTNGPTQHFQSFGLAVLPAIFYDMREATESIEVNMHVAKHTARGYAAPNHAFLSFGVYNLLVLSPLRVIIQERLPEKELHIEF